MYFSRTVDEITAEWLTNALRESGAIQEARVVSFDIKALDGGFAGEVDRIVPVYDRNAPGFPDSFVIKLSHREADQRIMLDDRGLYRTEVGVYHALGSRDNIRLPRMYFADYDAGTGFCCLLLEDLSQFRPGHAFDSMTRPDADACMGYLARLHANWWNNAGLSEFE